MAEYIDRDIALNAVLHADTHYRAYHKLAEVPVADVVTRAAYMQVVLERDTAIAQLKEIGNGLGEEMDDVVELKRDKHREKDTLCDKCDRLSQCRCDEIVVDITITTDSRKHYMLSVGAICPNCGADMRIEA